MRHLIGFLLVLTGIIAVLMILILSPVLNTWAPTLIHEGLTKFDIFLYQAIPPAGILTALAWAGVLIYKGWGMFDVVGVYKGWLNKNRELCQVITFFIITLCLIMLIMYLLFRFGFSPSVQWGITLLLIIVVSTLFVLITERKRNKILTKIGQDIISSWWS